MSTTTYVCKSILTKQQNRQQQNHSATSQKLTMIAGSAAFLPRRVVVTGMGAISPLGTTLMESWEALLQNKCGVTTLDEALTTHQDLPDHVIERELKLAQSLPCQVAAPVKGIKNDNRTSRFVQLALLAGAEAIQSANLKSWLGETNDHDEKYQHRRDRVGVCVGSGMSSVREISEAVHIMEGQGLRRLSPHFVPKVLSNSAAARLSIAYGLGGPNHSASTACAAGSHAIGDAMRCIQYNDADIMLAGGAESSIDPLSMAGFCRLRALSSGFPPMESSRPFDRLRNGFVMGEGSSILVLEELNHAKQRGAPILAELMGYGLAGDGFHITAPDPAGRGAERAMRMAMSQAGSDGSDVGYVNAHATSTPKGDEIEAQVIDRVIQAGSHSPQNPLFVSSSKGSTGHLLGAAGALEAAFTVMSLVDQAIPPTLNLDEIDGDEVGFQHVTETKKVDNLCAAMSNSFGFGGTNAALFFRTYNEDNVI
jgi:3-oxoacyl-[acyl-carrier-protein] synthase II